jgi:uncharacterized protein
MEVEKAEERSLCGKNALIRSLLLSIVLPALLAAAPQDFPPPQGYVNDFAGVIEDGAQQRIRAICEELEQKTGAELAVVTVASVGDMDYAEYSGRLFEKWGIGKKGKNNGVMLFLTVGERRVRVEVGYGLEGILPDITAGRLLDQYVLEDFRRGDYSTGLLRGAIAIAGFIAAEAGVTITGAPRPNLRRPRSREGRGIGKLFIPLLIFLFLVRPRWLLPFLMMGGGRRGGWGGGGFGGGFGGGGFGGFGGGMGGGGGAGRGF